MTLHWCFAFSLIAALVACDGSTDRKANDEDDTVRDTVEASVRSTNRITEENALPGSPRAEWDVLEDRTDDLQGYATKMSWVPEETVLFKIDANEPYSVFIYRLGYYNGLGARKVGEATLTYPTPQQPKDACKGNRPNIAFQCSEWIESAEWRIPKDAVSGVYIAKIIRNSDKKANQIVFVVRDDRKADLLFQTADATWQAYNSYHGWHLYCFKLPALHDPTQEVNVRSYHVSYDRPFATRQVHHDDFLFNAEYPMIRWLERNGYDVTYTTCIDVERRSLPKGKYKVFLSVGHDEYWSKQQRDHVAAACDGGTHLAFFSGNSLYWKTRWISDREFVCYKEGRYGEVCDEKRVADPERNVWTGLWSERSSRMKDNYPAQPAVRLIGQGSWRPGTSCIVVPGAFAKYPFWRHTSIASLREGEEAYLTYGSLGYEWDRSDTTDKASFRRIGLSYTRETPRSDQHVHQLSLYRAKSGALVFAAGTVQWAWGLDGSHDGPKTLVDIRMQQATVNILSDMDTHAASLQADLVDSPTTPAAVWDHFFSSPEPRIANAVVTNMDGDP